MRFLSRTLLFSCVAVAANRDNAIKIDCESGYAETARSPSVQRTNAECRQSCHLACANVKVERDLDGCLSHSDLEGCLFQMSRTHDVDAHSCFASSAGLAPTLVFSIDAREMMDIGDVNSVESVMLMAELEDAHSLEKCADRSISLGVSTQSNTDDRHCQWTGATNLKRSFTVQNGYLTANLTDLVTPAVKSRQALNLFGTFSDVSCGALDIKDVELAFSMKYTDGFRPSPTCSPQFTCQNCASQGCAWCDWSQRAFENLPHWLPDWHFVNRARHERMGQCGVNSAVCDKTDGKLKTTCGAVATDEFPTIPTTTLSSDQSTYSSTALVSGGGISDQPDNASTPRGGQDDDSRDGRLPRGDHHDGSEDASTTGITVSSAALIATVSILMF